MGDCKSDRFKCNPRYVDIDTCQTNSVTTLSQLANGPKVLEAKITDFGLARLMNPVDTHLSTLSMETWVI